MSENDYVSPEEAVQICKDHSGDGDHPVWGLLSMELRLRFEMLESAGLRIVRASEDVDG